ncbi:hypothetical protein ACWGDT_01420 [Streptomyces avermitilis]
MNAAQTMATTTAMVLSAPNLKPMPAASAVTTKAAIAIRCLSAYWRLRSHHAGGRGRPGGLPVPAPSGTPTGLEGEAGVEFHARDRKPR